MGFKMKLQVPVVVLLSCVFCLQVIVAEAGPKKAVEVLQAGDDNIGVRFAYHIKEEIRKSTSYRLSSVDEPRFIIRLITTDSATLLKNDLKAENRGFLSIVSVTYTFYNKNIDIFLNGLLMTVGRETIKEQAEEIVSRIEKIQ